MAHRFLYRRQMVSSEVPNGLVRNINPADTGDVIAGFPAATARDVNAPSRLPRRPSSLAEDQARKAGRVLLASADIARQRADRLPAPSAREGKVLKRSQRRSHEGLRSGVLRRRRLDAWQDASPPRLATHSPTRSAGPGCCRLIAVEFSLGHPRLEVSSCTGCRE